MSTPNTVSHPHMFLYQVFKYKNVFKYSLLIVQSDKELT